MCFFLSHGADDCHRIHQLPTVSSPKSRAFTRPPFSRLFCGLPFLRISSRIRHLRPRAVLHRTFCIDQEDGPQGLHSPLRPPSPACVPSYHIHVQLTIRPITKEAVFGRHDLLCPSTDHQTWLIHGVWPYRVCAQCGAEACYFELCPIQVHTKAGLLFGQGLLRGQAVRQLRRQLTQLAGANRQRGGTGKGEGRRGG